VTWWRDAAIYQVYLRSFADGDGDGIGDIAGLESRLGYLRELGVDALWINPWYVSPMADGGYDVADYRQIDPAFGSLQDAERLIEAAHRFGLRIIVDLVPNHTSDQHPWFQEALRSEPGSPARERFHFQDEPNNWQSRFGGPAWSQVDDGQSYLHLFDASQPDLNWDHPEVRAEFLSILRFWLDRGVDGFRIDVAARLVKQAGLPDKRGRYEGVPTFDDDPDEPDKDRPEVHEIYRDWRLVLGEYGDDRVFVGEIWVVDPERFAMYLRPDELHTAFNFAFLKCAWEAGAFRDVIDRTLATHARVGAPPTWVLSNHDVTRHVTRYGRKDSAFMKRVHGVPTDLAQGTRRARAAALLSMALPGGVYVYQGDELGLPEVFDLPDARAYDYVIDRQTSPQSIEAYKSDGTFLWEVDLGPNSTNQDNIEPGSATIDVGHNDGVTVYDFNMDGRAEVALKIADGVTFGDGATWTHADDNRQFMAILDGQTGALRNWAAVPTDYIADGPMAARFGVGYLDGVTPSLVAFMKNRKDDGSFNLMIAAWNWSGANLTQKWKWLRGSTDAPDGHNTRIIDVNGDGKDEVAEIGFVLNGDGTLRYSLASQGIIHGDRFHIADMDPSRPGLEGYGVQQNNASGLREYYYDASTGQMIWKHTLSGTADVGRGMAGDVDPRFPGMEVWSFDGLYNASQNKLTEPDTGLRPWPQLGLWWDGDLTMELLNAGKIEEWDPLNPTPTGSLPRIESTWNYGAVTAAQSGPTLVGDLFGDWREEVVYTNAAYDELVIFTTDKPTSARLYTLAHNPAYRNAMTLHGYMQSHHVDYFLGAGMSTPPAPRITY
jgi:rhamnogalacturonan endolyase